MGNEKQEQLNSRTANLRANLAERRASASQKFSAFEERASIAPEMAAITRDESLNAMLQRIKLNTRGVIYGEATESPNSGLPILAGKLQLT